MPSLPPQSSTENQYKSSHRRIRRRILYSLAAIYVVCSVVGGIGLGWIALHPPSPPITETEEHNAQAYARERSIEFRDVTLTTPDGVVLRAWFIHPLQANGDAAIILHGVSDNRLGSYGYAQWLLENHYSILIPDARGHGNSGGLATYGIRESDDIHRWVDWIEANAPARCVYGLGESMGAAQLLQALPHEPRFCAVVAESPFASFREVAYARFGRPFHTGPWIGRTLFRPTVDAGFLYAWLKYGLNMETASPQRSVIGVKTPILLIHGLNDHNIPPYHSDLIRGGNPEFITVWKVPNAVHTGAHAAAPEEFERRVLSWFQNNGPQ